MTNWKQKLAAYLHDPPSKCLDIRTHGERSDAAFRQAGFVDTEVGEYFAYADHTGAAADRLPFPSSQAAGLTCAFDGVRNGFLHPLSGQKLSFHAEFGSTEQGFEGESSVQPDLSRDSLSRLADDDERWRARFMAHWRLWPKHAAEKDYRLALLPADTRIPDHSIWTHMQVVSALAGCVGDDKTWQPAFLRFQLGPVQDFIAAARSTRDLWSGSYLLSWLMAAGLKALSEQVGPDAVIFPNLRGQPLFDLHWRADLWNQVSISGQGNVWESLGWKERELLTPNLPNVFLAVVPASRAAELAKHVADAIRAEWRRIADAVWNQCEKAGPNVDEGDFSVSQRKERFDSQVKRFLSLSWQATPWPSTLEEAMKLAEGYDDTTPLAQARARVQRVIEMAEKEMPVQQRDRRFYTDDTRTRLNNIGLGWSVILARNSWELDGVRQTRAFEAANGGGWTVGTFSNKDALTGREEAVAGGEKWFAACEKLGDFWPGRFKQPHWLGATTLIKRLWDIAYLKPQWGLGVQKSPNTRGVAAHDPFAKDDRFNDEEQADAVENQGSSEKYFAVLAFDGDEIGKWISGEKTPQFDAQLADYSDGSQTQRYGAKSYFGKSSFGDFLQAHRPLSPSYHLQFSEALGNFALLCARPIVEAFDGRLIYAGGDDVVALLPADSALECAQTLRCAFQGREVPDSRGNTLFKSPAPGFLTSDMKDDHGRGRPIPFLVPGPKADCSVGIAIAHFKSPLQDVVRAAQAAEKRAKRRQVSGGLERKAVAVTLMKRSGEIIEWGAKWDGGLALYHALASSLDGEQLSGKFPHRFAELLEPYVIASTPMVRQLGALKPLDGFPVEKVAHREFEHCLLRQRGSKFPKEKAAAEDKVTGLRAALQTYLASIQSPGGTAADSERIFQSLIGLCQTVAFAHRTATNSETDSEPKGHA